MKFKQKATLEGRSFIFNLLFVLINLTGLTLVVMGSHANFEAQSTPFKVFGYLLLTSSSILILVFRGRLLMSSVSRVLVGGLFIVSGLVKANDPIGFAYKLEEYFEDGALAYRIKELFNWPSFSLEFMIDSALFLSVLICIVEIVLGVLTIIGGKIKLVSYLMLLMMFFFTFLTWHTANCDASKKYIDRDTYAINEQLAQIKLEEAKTNKSIKIISKSSTELVVDEMKQPQCVSDCGCFGDAMKGSIGRSLTPKESLWKDIILVYLVLWIFISQWIIDPNTRSQNRGFIVASMLVIVFFSWVFGWYFPVIFSIVVIYAALWVLNLKNPIISNYYGSSVLVTGATILLTSYVLHYEPLKDYRPYAEGSNLIEKMNDGEEGKYESMLVYVNKKTGEKKEYSSTSKEYLDSKIWEKTEWKYLEMSQKEIIASKIPSITDQFNPFLPVSELTQTELKMPIVKQLMTSGTIKGLRLRDYVNATKIEIPMDEYSTENYPSLDYAILDTVQLMNPEFTEVSLRDYIVHEKTIFMLTSKNLKDASWEHIDRYKEIVTYCRQHKIPFILVTNSNRLEIDAFRKANNFDIPIFLNDETELKAIARSNPSLMVLQKGIVKGKYPTNSTPSVEWLKKNCLQK
jgi:uncharacterized membrane protein YphA (DoxX/SURF4 family)